MKASIGEIRHRNFEIIIILTLFEEQRMLRPFLNNANDLTGKDVPLQILLRRSLPLQDHNLFRTDTEANPFPFCLIKLGLAHHPERFLPKGHMNSFTDRKI